MTDNKPGLGDACYSGHTWATYMPHEPAQCVKCGAIRPACNHCQHIWDKEDAAGNPVCIKCDKPLRTQQQPAKRYQVIEHKGMGAFVVVDTWTKTQRGAYTRKELAQARARTLNSRNGGK
jgi:hypothetical protein